MSRVLAVDLGGTSGRVRRGKCRMSRARSPADNDAWNAHQCRVPLFLALSHSEEPCCRAVDRPSRRCARASRGPRPAAIAWAPLRARRAGVAAGPR